MIQIFKAATFDTKTWAGGTTTELFIDPQNANYANRDFDFRLSTATIEVEKSEFTQLPGYARKLMVLEGETILHHEKSPAAKLVKFGVDAFDGGEKTSSAGRCTDFNVMTKPLFESTLFGVSLQKEEIYLPEITAQNNYFFVYVFSGAAQINCAEKQYILQSKDLLVAQEGVQISLKAVENCNVVFAGIGFRK